jgi:hypothetical protein
MYTPSLDSRASELGLDCRQYEKLVWRKENASFEDASTFKGLHEQRLEITEQFNEVEMSAFTFGYLFFRTIDPVFIGTWSFQGGKILEGDTEDTLYVIYQACRAL